MQATELCAKRFCADSHHHFPRSKFDQSFHLRFRQLWSGPAWYPSVRGPGYFRADVRSASGNGIPSGSVTFKEGAANLLSTSFVLNTEKVTLKQLKESPLFQWVRTTSLQPMAAIAVFNASNSAPVAIRR